MIWKRYIYRELLRFFAFFLAAFFVLYVVIDYSTHMQEFLHSKHLPLWKVFEYYIFQFVKRSDILVPLALLIGTVKVLCQLNTHKELLAFQSAGIHLNQVLRPLFIVGGLCALFLLGVNQFVVPHSLNFIDRFYDAHLRHSHRGKRADPLHVVHLDDHSKLVYQYYDHAKEAFFDVIWIKSPDDLWRMRYLKADPEYPQGQWVDHLQRAADGRFEKGRSFSTLIFRDLDWKKDLPRKGYIPFENRSIQDLWTMREDPYLSNYDKQEILTQLLFKLTMPLLALIVVLAAAPSCTRHAKSLPQFFIYGFALFGFVAFIALMDAAVILGESDTLSPFVAILTPFAVLFGAFGWRFIKAR